MPRLLHHRTGDWMRWRHAQRDGWHRVFSWPWDGLRHAANGVTSGQFTTDWAFAFRVEIVAVAVGVCLLVWLARRGRWAELVFVGLQLWALTTSYWWESIARSSLTWWPLWIALAGWSLRRPTVLHWLLAVFAPLMVAYAVVFTNGRWAG